MSIQVSSKIVTKEMHGTHVCVGCDTIIKEHDVVIKTQFSNAAIELCNLCKKDLKEIL
jgi:transcription initiation factor TFIIIB Brf1 subunit/transcription initiation factor TFIIB